MAVPDWPGTFGYNLFLYPWTTWWFGPWDVFVEHGHRLLGAAVGLLAIAVVVIAWRLPAPRSLRWLAVAALAAVIGQGVLGGARVLLNERSLAQIHACTGPAFLAFAWVLALVASPRWRVKQQTLGKPPSDSTLVSAALFAVAAAFLQIVLGSFLRHVPADGASRLFAPAVAFHVVNAFVVAALAARLAWTSRARKNAGALAAAFAAGLAWVQIGLGLGTWFVNYGWPSILGEPAFAQGHVIVAQGMAQTMVATAHQALGASLLALLSVAATWSLRPWFAAIAAAAAWRISAGHLSGGAIA